MSDIPFVKDFPFAYGEAGRMSPLVRRVIANNPGPFTYTGSGTYIVGAKEVAIIDPGPDDPAHIDALVAATQGERVTHILVTHTHRDHSGGAARLKTATGAPVFAFGPHPLPRDLDGPALEEGGDHAFRPDHTMRDGEAVSGPGWTLTALHTPGHISNHLCFALKEEAALFTGDHIMGWATTVIIPPDGDMGDYFDSLDLLLAREDRIYYPTHGAPIESPRRFVRAVKAHRLMRDGQIVRQLEQGRTQIGDIVAVMYAGVDKRLHGAAALNVLAHLQRMVRMGTVACDSEPTLGADYRRI